MQSAENLRDLLRKIDHRGYPAYKDTKGQYAFPGYVLSIDHVQGDPFASPSKISIHMKGAQAGFPVELYDMPCKRIALQDYLIRQFEKRLGKYSFQAKGSGKSGLLSMTRPGQEILERTACGIREDGGLLLRLEVGFPANGRTVNAGELSKIFFEFLPDCVRQTLYYQSLDEKVLKQNADLAEDQQYIRKKLTELGLVAFVANGAVLPRESGISGRPMKGGVTFQAPDSLEIFLTLPNFGEIKGMGIKKGVTLIVGGGYHGKSTLLKALELGVYNHIAGDGREYVITDNTAVKIRAEDGRSIQDVDISMFIRDLPNGKDTRCFYTEDASGSTSQAANIIEGMEAGAGVFLIDEDTSATNFMIRDELMQRVVHRDAEPITPFIERVRKLYEDFGISTVLVAGSCGSYFHKADCVLQMNRYVPHEITREARTEAAHFPIKVNPAPEIQAPDYARHISSASTVKGQNAGKDGHAKYGRGGRVEERTKIKGMGKDGFSINKDIVDLRYVEQIADAEQVSALAYLLAYAMKHLFDGRRTMQENVNILCKLIEEKGLEAVCEGNYLPANLALPRKQEIFACFNRFRMLRVR